jgi:membrane protein DedA with SNARE-associated domain
MNRKRVFIIAVMLLFVCQPLMAQEGAGVAEAVRGDSASTGWVAWVLHKYDKHMNYWTVGGLMAIESSFIPFPSEVVIPPAVYVALDEHSQSGMNWWLVVIFGTLGALVGAFINYFLSRWLGRPIIYAFVDSKLGHILQLSGEKMERAEKYFNDHGVFSTLVGRLIPVVRQLISIPAGLSRMNIGTFALYTTLGALIWNCVLALLGYLAHLAGDISVVEKYSSEISYIIIGLVILVALILTVRYFIKKNRKK